MVSKSMCGPPKLFSPSYISGLVLHLKKHFLNFLRLSFSALVWEVVLMAKLISANHNHQKKEKKAKSRNISKLTLFLLNIEIKQIPGNYQNQANKAKSSKIDLFFIELPLLCFYCCFLLPWTIWSPQPFYMEEQTPFTPSKERTLKPTDEMMFGSKTFTLGEMDTRQEDLWEWNRPPPGYNLYTFFTLQQSVWIYCSLSYTALFHIYCESYEGRKVLKRLDPSWALRRSLKRTTSRLEKLRMLFEGHYNWFYIWLFAQCLLHFHQICYIIYYVNQIKLM